MTATDPPSDRRRNEAGQAGGVEALAFGALLFIAGTLLVANAWSVIDAKFSVISAAREGAATYVETGGDAAAAESPAERATTAALDSLRRAGTVTIELGDGGYRRCGRVRLRVMTEVPVLRIPFVGGAGGTFTVAGASSRLIDPYRSAVTGEASC